MLITYPSPSQRKPQAPRSRIPGRERSPEVPSVPVQRVLPEMKTGNYKGKSDSKKREQNLPERQPHPLPAAANMVGWGAGRRASRLELGLQGWEKCAEMGCLLWAHERGCGQAEGSPDVAPAGAGTPIQLLQRVCGGRKVFHWEREASGATWARQA